MTDPSPTLDLARRAAQGETGARRQVTQLADPIIRNQTDRFCRRFCYENRFRYRCSLQRPLRGAPPDAALCEWGNGSYAWMLDDLTKSERLQRFESKDGATLDGYFFTIATSLPFYERWKEWRFGKRVHTPTYLRPLCDAAAKIFLGLRRGDKVETIAQRIGESLDAVRRCARAITLELTRRNRLHLLQTDRTVSLSELGARDDDEGDDASDYDIPAHDHVAERDLDQRRLRDAWQRLEPVEQWVLQAMLVEDQDANDVLAALREQNLRVDPRTAPEQTDRQQLYYFRRKALAKLAALMGVE
jgi:hypothetical protein